MRGSSTVTNQVVRSQIWLLTAAFFILSSSVCGFAASALFSPRNAIAHYVHDSWTHQNGLPGEAVYQIIQTDDGYLWLRISSGLVRFDGVRFVRGDPIVDGQPVREQVKAICKGADGDLLVRTASRTLIYKNGKFSDYRAPAALPDGVVLELFETKAHQVFVGADNFIYLISDGGIRLLQERTGPVETFFEDKEGVLWIGCIQGLYTYRDGRLSIYRGAKARDIHVLAEDRQHNLWLGTGLGLYRMHPNKPILKRFAPGQIRGEVRAILQDFRGNLWVGSSGSGVFRLADGRWSSYKTTDGLSDDNVLSLYQDREGSIWVGTTDGLNRFRDTKFTTFTVADGLPSNNGGLVTEAEDGSVYTFCQQGGLARIKSGVVSQVANQGALAHLYAGSLFASKDGSLWIGTEKGLVHFKNGTFTFFKSPGPLSGYISAIAEDDESLIFASNIVVYRLKDGTAKQLTFGGRETSFSQPAHDNYTFDIYRDKSGTMWFGAVGGLFKFSKGEIPENARLTQINFPVTSIYDDGKGYLWLGGRTPGVTRLRIQDGRVTRYASQQGLFDEYPTRILSDRRDNLWVSTPNGIYWISRRDLDDVAEGRIRKVSATIYDTSDGLRTTEAANPGAQPGGWRTRDGKLWFSMRKGLVVIDPDHIRHNGQVPPVRMEEIVVDQKTLLPSANIELKPGTNNLELHYTALSFLVPQRVRFKYKLEGYDRDWVDAGPRRVAYYTKLPPGEFRFRVIASNDDGVWNETGASLGFRLRPHFYQTYWFYGAFLIGILLSGVGLHHVRIRRLRTRERQLLRIVDERTAELRKYKDHLEDQVAERTTELMRSEEKLRQAQKMEAIGRLAGGIAHDFNNLLNVIAGYTELMLYQMPADAPLRSNAEKIRNASDKAAGLTRQLLVFSRQQTPAPKVLDLNTAVREVGELLPRLIGEDIEIAVHTSSEEARVRLDPSQLQQIILNLAVNARDALPKGGSLIITTECVDLNDEFEDQQLHCAQGRYVQLSVTDTGTGIPKELQAHIFEPFFTTKELGKGTGLGLSTVYGIVQRAGGGISVYSEPGLGATFKIYLPRVEEAVEAVPARTLPGESLRGAETILLVEDEDELRALMDAFLEKQGYTVLAAGRPSEALDLARQRQQEIHLLLTDVVMPGMEGPELARNIHSLFPRIRVLFMSGHTPDAILREVKLAAECSFLAKPVDLQTLARKLREMLTARRVA